MSITDAFEYDGVNLLKNGRTAGRNVNGYTQVYHKGRRYYAHRIIWEKMCGKIPEGFEIDHINHIKSDNRIDNLRMVSKPDQQRNLSIRKDNTSGHCGVSKCSKTGKWIASLSINGKQIQLGRFASKIKAVECRQAANVKYGFHENHGDKL